MTFSKMTCSGWGEGTGAQGGGLRLEVETRPHQVAVCRSHGRCGGIWDSGSQFSNSSRLGFKQCLLLSPTGWGNFPVDTNSVELAQIRFLLKRMLVEKPSLCSRQPSVKCGLSRILSAPGRRRWVRLTCKNARISVWSSSAKPLLLTPHSTLPSP